MSTLFIDEVQAANILQQMWEQCETDQFCDVMLIVGAEEIKIPAHRNILSTATEYFKGMFTSLRESREKEVKILSVDGHALKSLIKFFYTGRVEIREDNVQELLETADMLFLNNVVKACANFLVKHIDPDNCLGFTLLAERYHCHSFLEYAKEYSLKHFTDVYKSQEFLKLNIEQLGQLLASDNLRVTSEEDVFKSLQLWLEHDRYEREKYKDNLFKLIRMPLLDPLFLYVHVKPVCTSTASLQLYMEGMEWQSLRDRNVLNLSMSTKSRRTRQYLIGITLSRPNHKMHIHYYCPQELKWMKWSNHLEYRYDFDVATMGHNVYITGGRDATSGVLNTVLCLNMNTMTISPVNAMTERRTGCSAAVLNGFLYVVGGYNGRSYLSSVERLDPKTNTWNKVASLSAECCWFGAVELNKKLYAVGKNVCNTLKSVECYDPDKNVWTIIESMSKHHYEIGVAVVDGLLYTISGLGLKTVERYDSVKNQWSTICSLRNCLVASRSCTTFQDKVIVCYNDTVDEYDATIDEWKTNQSLRGLANINCIFSYSDDFLKTEFTEN